MHLAQCVSYLWGTSVYEDGTIHLVDSESGDSHEVLSLLPDTVEWYSIDGENRWLYIDRWIQEADVWLLTLNEER
ncbi:MAG: hypothetical protein ACE5JI_14150 [Acidobacteriota bacterium]